MNKEQIITFVTETKKDELKKLSMKQLVSMQKEMGMSERKPKNKTEAVEDLKRHVRAINRGRAFAEM